MRTTRFAVMLALAGAMALGGCDTDFLVPDLNNPGLEGLLNNPTPAAVIDATQGLMIGARTGVTGQGGYVARAGILGREVLVFDNSDPRYIDELLAGDLNAGGFGGFGWGDRYANLRNAAIVLGATDAVSMEEADKEAIRGFTKTIMATDLYWVAQLRNQFGGVVDIPAFEEELAPFVPLGDVFQRAEDLLQEAVDHLAAAGDFPFALSSGFEGFDDPASFSQVAWALKARIDVMQATMLGATDVGEYNEALTALGNTWVSQAAPLDQGVYHTFSTNSGDAVNGLFQGPSPQIVAHPSLKDVVQTKPGGAPDDRFAAKTEPLAEAIVDPRGVSSDLRFTVYPTQGSPVPIITNEELLLLRAEARWFTGNRAGAISDLNHVRRTAGGLPAYGLFNQPITDAEFIDALMYERLMSLLFEQAVRFIDARRFDRIDELPLDRPSDVIPVSFPIPRAECLARELPVPCGA